MKRIAILALENCLQSSVTGFFDILSVASRQYSLTDPKNPVPLFDLAIVSDDGEPITCFNGLILSPHMGRSLCKSLDIIMIPVIYGDLTPILANTELINWLREQHSQGVCISAVCAGVFPMAQTGLLSGRTATTHWLLAQDFQKQYPEVRLKPEKMLVDEGSLITAGGVTAYMDLALYLTARFGSPDLASSVSKNLLIDPARTWQTPYARMNFNMAHGDETILFLQNWMDENLSDSITVSDLASQASLGQRTLARRFKKATGDTPLEYLQHLRIGKARTLLETTNTPIEQITWDIGYEDVSSFRRLFKRITHLSPTAYRKRFGLFRR